MPTSALYPPVHHITPFNVFEWSGLSVKLVVIALCIALVAAIVVLGVKISGGRRLAGGSTFLSGLRAGGPIIGALGASYSLLSMTLGYAGVRGDPPLKVLAPGIAEAFLQIGFGLLAGAVAVLAHWAVESRIDRQVLGV
jgi:hypothetical protein